MRLVIFFLVLLAACSSEPPPAKICTALDQGCVLPLGPSTLQVRSNIAPKPLRPFKLEVTLPHAKNVEVSLSMQGMNMGTNRYRLTPDAQGVWRGTLTLPVCVSGRRDWLMTIDADGRTTALTFSTPE